MNKKYITLKNSGKDFRTLARIMTQHGFPMNHATARNQLILAIESLITGICNKLKTNLSPRLIKEMTKKQEIHNQLSDVLLLVYKDLKKEELKYVK